MSHAADLTLITLEFIFGVWVALIPMGLLIFFHVRAWRATDVALPTIERFNQTIRATLWESLAVLALIIVLRNFTYWFSKYLEERDSDSE